MALIHALGHELSHVPAFAPQRKSPWILVQSPCTLRADRVASKRHEARMQAEALRLTKVREARFSISKCENQKTRAMHT